MRTIEDDIAEYGNMYLKLFCVLMCGCYGLKFHEIVVSSSSSSELSNRSADSQIYRKLSECGLNDPEHKVVYRVTRG